MLEDVRRLADDLHIFDISVVAGVRACGKTIDYKYCGRRSNGFLFVLDGEVTIFEDERKTIVISNDELAFLPKYKKYRLEYTAPSTTFVVVNFDMRDKNNDDVVLSKEIVLVEKDDVTHRIAKIMNKFELCSTSKTTETTLRKKELMYRLLAAVYAQNFSLATRSEISEQIADGVYLLEKTYLENLPITQYAAASHVSVNTFRNAFQKEFGTPPLKYRNRLRIERAKELISECGFSVSEAAYASGFENIGYFCRYYRQVTGETPGETKRKYHAK
ncbi:MAG: AraC family transcriptional regulator [Clostridia bacterium]|nr:AraC family transcriptional regulator [Clostridia bacterium]